MHGFIKENNLSAFITNGMSNMLIVMQLLTVSMPPGSDSWKCVASLSFEPNEFLHSGHLQTQAADATGPKDILGKETQRTGTESGAL